MADFRGAYQFYRSRSHVSNEIKACLDSIALSVQQSDARLYIIGHFIKGSESPRVAGQRAVNIKFYLHKDRGVDPSRIITLYVGSVDEASVHSYLVPAHTDFTQEPGALPVPLSIKPVICDIYYEGNPRCEH